MQKIFLFAILISASFLFLSETKCAVWKSGQPDSTKVRHSETEGKAYKVRATVIKIYRDEKKITLKHGKIKGYMPAMTMTYSVSKPSLLGGIEEGRKGIFTIFVFKGLPMVTGIKIISTKHLRSSRK